MVNFREYLIESLSRLPGARSGGSGGNWGGAQTKLISLLPPGNWVPTSLKRSKKNTASGYLSDHYIGNSNSYAADFGLNTTFGGNVKKATEFAIKVANNAGANINSWNRYKGGIFNTTTSDGFRVQVIWQSNVGGNHYDHVHVGVKGGSGSIASDDKEEIPNSTDNYIDSPTPPPNEPEIKGHESAESALQALYKGFNTISSYL